MPGRGASRAIMRQSGEVKGVEMMGVRVAGREARERGGRRLEVEVNSKRLN